MKNIIILVIIIAAVWLVSSNLDILKGNNNEDQTNNDVITIHDFEECLAAGYPAMESYPRQCQDDQGNLFVENIGNELEKDDLIRIDSPRPNQTVTSPLTITGQARGYWFFEGDFPIVLIGSQGGNILVESHATTESDWMTEEFIPFNATIEFESPGTGAGILILEKDNPSGLPENFDSLTIPVKF
jgi:hypothetical protein